MNNKLKHELLYISAFLLTIAFIGWDFSNGKDVEAQVQPQAVEGDSIDVGQASGINITPQPPMDMSDTPEATPSASGEVEEYILEVYGQDFDKAMLVLKGVQDLNGKDICGGENRTLNPKAFYTNSDGSRDRGIFQISEKYHPSVSDECAFDYKCNIDYSFRMFTNDNNTFSQRWAAGACLKEMGWSI